jgi:hypothetical protein
MNEFDLVIKETIGDTLKGIGSAISSGAGAIGSTVGNIKSAIQPVFDIAKGAYSSSSLKSLSTLFDAKKSELKYVTYDTATSSLKSIKEPTRVSTMGETSTAKVFSSTTVMMDNVFGFSGLKGQIVNFEKPYSLDFKLFINQVTKYVNEDADEESNIDVESFLFQTKPKRFWVKISSKTPSLAVSESFDSIVDNELCILNEAQKMVPPNEVSYATWFIYDSNKPEFKQKFKITLANQRPDISLGKAFRLDDMSGNPSGLIQVGQDTLYPRWYFLNDLLKYKQEDDKKNQTPTGINVPSSYTGDVKIS